MARWDVYPAPGRTGSGYVVDIQADLLAIMTTRVVIPLLPAASVQGGAARLNPVFEIEGQRYALMTQLVGTVPRRALVRPVTSLRDHHDTLIAAIDLLITGF